MKIQAALSALILVASFASARQNTTRRLHVAAAPQSVAENASTAYTDTIVSPEAHSVDIIGYDKPLRSRREVFFVTNNVTDTVAAIAYTIKYYDTQRRMLHSASEKAYVEIPPKETRQVNKKSWDPQFNFYFIRSAVPQRAEKVTPYEVTITVDTIFTR